MPRPTPCPPAPAPAATPSDATPAPAPAESHQAHAQLLQSHVSQLELQLRAQLQAAARSESQRCEAVALHAALQHDLSVAQAEVGRLSAQLAHIAGHSEEQAAQLGEVAERESDLVSEARRGALERSLLQVLAATLEAEAVDSGTRAAAALAQNRQLLSEMQARSHARPPARLPARCRAVVPYVCVCRRVCALRSTAPPTDLPGQEVSHLIDLLEGDKGVVRARLAESTAVHREELRKVSRPARRRRPARPPVPPVIDPSVARPQVQAEAEARIAEHAARARAAEEKAAAARAARGGAREPARRRRSRGGRREGAAR